MKSTEHHREVLEARLAELKARMEQIDAELDSAQTRDWEELAVEREGDEVLEGMGLSAQDEIKAIEAALQRIDEGEYGYCMKCGSEIEEARLDLVPFTPFCASCARSVGT